MAGMRVAGRALTLAVIVAAAHGVTVAVAQTSDQPVAARPLQAAVSDTSAPPVTRVGSAISPQPPAEPVVPPIKRVLPAPPKLDPRLMPRRQAGQKTSAGQTKAAPGRGLRKAASPQPPKASAAVR